ncbi:TPA: hypothetical protein RZC51_001556 [Burkholderia cenocepacia]|nr:hypothetical protein [Burkholderia cenocepacia]
MRNIKDGLTEKNTTEFCIGMVRKYGRGRSNYVDAYISKRLDNSQLIALFRFPENGTLLFEIGLEDLQIHCTGIANAPLGKFRQPPVGKIRIATDFSPVTLSCQ